MTHNIHYSKQNICLVIINDSNKEEYLRFDPKLTLHRIQSNRNLVYVSFLSRCLSVRTCESEVCVRVLCSYNTGVRAGAHSSVRCRILQRTVKDTTIHSAGYSNARCAGYSSARCRILHYTEQ